MNGKLFSCFLIAGPMPTSDRHFRFPLLVSPEPCRNRMTGYSFFPS